MDPEWFTLTRANLVEIYIPLVAALIIVASVVVAVMHLRAYHHELEQRAATQREADERTQKRFDEQVFWATLSALVLAEADLGKSRVNPTDDMHRWHGVLKSFVEGELEKLVQNSERAKAR